MKSGKMGSQLRVAVLIPDFSIQSYMRDLVNVWHAAGHEIDVFATRGRYSLDTVDDGSLRAEVFRVDICDIPIRVLRFVDRALAKFDLDVRNRYLALLAKRIANVSDGRHYDLYIGVEKAGLIIAHELGRRYRRPYVYYSLELYIEGHPEYREFKRFRRAEIRAHQDVLATIVQDRSRAGVLAAANGLRDDHPFVYLPVGVAMSEASAPRSVKLPMLDAIRPAGFIALYFGILTRRRRIEEVVLAAKRLVADEYILLHGPQKLDDLKLTSDGHVIISTGLLGEAELGALVAACQIGIAIYSNEPVNDRLTARSSHKIALYLRYGKPVIVPRNESYEELMRDFKCGEMIEDIAELPEAIRRIRCDYESYSAEATRAFNGNYDLSVSGPRVIGELVELTKRMHAAQENSHESGV